MSESHQVRIQSDGTPETTTVQLMDGNLIAGVIAARIDMDAGEMPRVVLGILFPIVDVHAEVRDVIFACPVCEQDVNHHCDPALRAEPF